MDSQQTKGKLQAKEKKALAVIPGLSLHLHCNQIARTHKTIQSHRIAVIELRQCVFLQKLHRRQDVIKTKFRGSFCTAYI